MDKPRRVLKHNTVHHGAHRRSLYPDQSDSIDAIMKGFRAIIDDGRITLPPDTVEWVEQCEAVKIRIPKKERPNG